jgi:hypothetical protein
MTKIKANWFGVIKTLGWLVVTSLLGACGYVPTNGFNGVVVAGGPVLGASVQMFPITPQGTLGTSLCSATTDSNGIFACAKTTGLAGPLMVTATGGNYTDLVSNRFVSLGTQSLSAIIQTVTTGAQSIAVTSLTDLSTSWAQQLLGQNAVVATAVTLSDSNLKLALGWPTQTRLEEITPTAIVPGMQTDFSNADANGHYALLAALSQLASTSGLNSAQLEAALAADFSDGIFDGKDSKGAPVNEGTVAGFSSLTSALTTYLASDINPGFTSTNLPAFTAMVSAPPIPLEPYNVLTPTFGTSVVISWNSAIGATSYLVNISTDPQCSTPGTLSYTPTTTSVALDPSLLIHGSTYYVCMLAQQGSQLEEPTNSAGGTNFSFVYP